MKTSLRQADSVAVVGLAFGDEGKGATIDALARLRPPAAVVRFNGGPQAAHHVVTEGGVHCFAQLGSGLLASATARSVSTARVLVEPLGLLREARALEELGGAPPLPRLFLDEGSVVVTPFHRLMNRAHELARGQGRHGSCGLGVGQAYMDALNPAVPTVRLGELRDPAALRRKMNLIRLMKLDQVDQLAEQTGHDLGPVLGELRRPGLIDEALRGYAELLARVPALAPRGEADARGGGEGPLLFEGAQGVLLDETHGFWPHVTPSTTTFAWADQWLGRRPYRLGVLRAFSTRHGAGPFVAERRHEALLRGEHNGVNDWQGAFRVGWFDLLLARHALAVAGGVDGLALTCLDRLAGLPRVGVVRAWRYDGDPDQVADLFEIDRSPAPTITALKHQEAPTRERQTRLTQALARCAPVVDEEPRSEGALVGLIERELGVEAVLLARGPAASGRVLRG